MFSPTKLRLFHAVDSDNVHGRRRSASMLRNRIRCDGTGGDRVHKIDNRRAISTLPHIEARKSSERSLDNVYGGMLPSFRHHFSDTKNCTPVIARNFPTRLTIFSIQLYQNSKGRLVSYSYEQSICPLVAPSKF